eukprot:Sspe_Gene.79452::Locus_49831_Transcript_1_5_Confidence_0.500_Length_742::g.79452::m.79452
MHQHGSRLRGLLDEWDATRDQLCMALSSFAVHAELSDGAPSILDPPNAAVHGPLASLPGCVDRLHSAYLRSLNTLVKTVGGMLDTMKEVSASIVEQCDAEAKGTVEPTRRVALQRIGHMYRMQYLANQADLAPLRNSQAMTSKSLLSLIRGALPTVEEERCIDRLDSEGLS